MNNQKGMTLIEVMVAMLVLSIAMIGGISFFTSAYRINYSYMESANRIDHALRYVEKLKVQRRNYPTFEAFPNLGGEGFTAFFVDSEFNDNVTAPPYFFEEYFAGKMQLPAKFTVLPFDYRGKKYFAGEVKKISVDPTYKGELISKHYKNNDYHNYRLSQAFGNGNAVKVRETNCGASYFLKYRYEDGMEKENRAYTEVTFSQMSKYSYDNRFYDNQYDPDRQMKKYNVKVDLSGMLSTNWRHSNGNYEAITFNTFTTGITAGIISTPGGRPDKVGLSNYNNENKVAPYSYISKNEPKEYKAKGFYENQRLSSPIVLKDGTPQENTGGGESSSIVMNYIFDSRRFYKERPDKTTQEEVRVRDKIKSVYEIPTLKDFSDPNKSVLKYPDPILVNSELYDRRAKYVALVYKNTITGKEQIKDLYEWKYEPGAETVAGSSTPVDPAYKYTISQFNLGPTKVNNHRVTRYRRSIYISIWPFKNKSEGITLIKNALSSGKDLNERIEFIKKYAKRTGRKTIVIPFIQLYAEDNNSTLCEAL